MLFLIVIFANMFSDFIVLTQLPQYLITQVQALGLPPSLLLVVIIISYLVLGCFLEGIGMILITVPVFLPIVVASGIDPIFFGVLVVVVVELGLITPPVGMNLFVIKAQARDIAIAQIYRGVLPYLIAPLLLLVLLLLFPQLALWLPGELYGGF